MAWAATWISDTARAGYFEFNTVEFCTCRCNDINSAAACTSDITGFWYRIFKRDTAELANFDWATLYLQWDEFRTFRDCAIQLGANEFGDL